MKKLLVAVLFLARTASADENWCLMEAEDEAQNLVLITVNLGYRSFARKAEYPWLLHINVGTLHQNKNGHPTNEEAPVLNALEDGLTASLKKATEVQYVGRATTKGHRELLYFVKDAEKANRLLVELGKKKQLRPWEFRISKDPRWRAYDDLVGSEPRCL